MKSPTTMGTNLTGIDMSPIQSKEVAAEALRTPPSSEGDSSNLREDRSFYIRQAERIGSVPPPGTMKGMAKTSLKKITGKKPEVFIDKLSERLAFERTGTRLYESFINKCKTRENEIVADWIPILEQIRSEEFQHMVWVKKAIETLGADPTTMTPSADTNAVASMGVLQVVNDPRTSLSESVQAILIAELTDNDGWVLLTKLALEMGMEDMARDFQVALDHERVHLENIRKLHEELVMREARVA